ncbi:MAG: cyclodeaminase/cyclohydrolase family protein [Ignavibacteriaceae bacterium]|nr:cyclodeaminase/cyclohydrolase family protein [Ignavibacteriaceae bacterium]
MKTQKSLKNYLDELSSNSPTPGGGNVSALCGVLASSLGVMVCNLTIGKKKYLEFEQEAKDLILILEAFKNDFLTLADKDNLSFDKVMEAFKLPKESDEQKTLRKEAIDKATMEAAIVPADVINKCKDLLPMLELIAEKGNQNSLSDAGVAISLTSTAAEGAFLNVAINCSGLSNQTEAAEFLKNAESIYEDIKKKKNQIISKIILKMKS